MSEPVSLPPKWYTVARVAPLLGYGESKVRMLIIAGDLPSLKDGRARRILPAWVRWS
jgi:excisionase family DNA binding protein